MATKHEAQTIEYKSSWQEEYFEWIAGYANAEGGTLYIGVNDDGYVVGVKDIKALLDKLPNQVASFLGITVSIDHNSAPALGVNLKYGEHIPKDIASKPVNLYARGVLTTTVLDEIDEDPLNTSNVSKSVHTLFSAASGFVKQLRQSKEYRVKVREDLEKLSEENPICENPDGSLDYISVKVNSFSHGVPYHGRYYIRSGGTNQELKGVELSGFLFDRVGMKWDSVPVTSVELDHEAIDFLRKHAQEKNRLTERAVAVSDETLIKNLKVLTNNGEYTRAAAMLFGDPEDVVFGAYIRIGFFENGRLKYHDEIHGPLISQAYKATDLIFAKYLKALVDIKGLQRTETYMTTEELLREVILNAVAHKHYPSNLAIQIRVTDDHITVMNEGYWPFDRLPVETVYEGEHSSYPANPLIGNGLFFAGAMDTWGQGFQLIKEECEKINAPLPEIKATGKYVEVTIKPCAKYRELLGTGSTSNSSTNLVVGEGAGEVASEGAGEVASEGADNLQRVITFCDTPKTKVEIQNMLGIKSDPYIRQKIIQALLMNGRLRRTIPEKPSSPNQKYVVTKTTEERTKAIKDNNPVLQMSPGDLSIVGQTVDDYLTAYSDAETDLYRDYYKDEIKGT